MKRSRWIGITVMLALVAALPGARIGAKGTSVAKVSFFLGALKLQPAQAVNWKNAVLNQPVYTGEKLKTEDKSRAEIMLTTGSVMRMDENSSLDVANMSGGGSKVSSQTKVWSGKVWANVNKMAKGSSFGLESPTAVAAARGTVYRMTVGTDSTTRIRVYQGKIEVKSPEVKKAEGGTGGTGGLSEVKGPGEVKGPTEVTMQQWSQIVEEQMEIVIQANGKPLPPTRFDWAVDAQDDWVQWNQERDKLLRR